MRVEVTSCRTPEDVRAQNLARNPGKTLQLGYVIDRDLIPLRGCAAAKAQSLRHGDDAAQFLRGLKNDGISPAHNVIYSTAKLRPSSATIPTNSAEARQWDMPTLGRQMRAARERAQKTQQQVADHLDVTKGAVSQWENDQTVPELEYFVEFCVYTDTSADEILLHREMDPLLRQLVQIWKRLSQDGRDTLLGNANRLLSKERPEPGPHNPFPSSPQPSLNTAKSARKSRQS